MKKRILLPQLLIVIGLFACKKSSGPSDIIEATPTAAINTNSSRLTLRLRGEASRSYEVQVSGIVVKQGTFPASAEAILVANIPLAAGLNVIVVRETSDGNTTRESSREVVVAGPQVDPIAYTPIPARIEGDSGTFLLDLSLAPEALDPVEVIIDTDRDGVIDQVFAGGQPVSVTISGQGSLKPIVTVRTASGLFFSTEPTASEALTVVPPTVFDPALALALPGDVADLAVHEATGDVFALLPATGTVQVVDSDGNLTATIPIPGASQPLGIFVDDDRNLYVADSGNNRVLKLRADFGYSPDPLIFPNGAFGTAGSGDGEFDNPTDCVVAVAGGAERIFVVDAGNARIQRFNRAGVFQLSWNGSEGGGVPLQSPRSAALLRPNAIAVTDGPANVVRVFLANGETAATLVQDGDTPLVDPVSVATSEGDNEIVVAGSDGRVHVFASDGNRRRVYAALTNGLQAVAVRNGQQGGRLLGVTSDAPDTLATAIPAEEASGDGPLATAQAAFAALAESRFDDARLLLLGEALADFEEAIAGNPTQVALVERATQTAVDAVERRYAGIAYVSATLTAESGPTPISLVLARSEESGRWQVINF